MSKKQRKNYSLRLQPYEGSLLAEIVDYFNSLDRDDAHQQISNLLVAGFLSLARYQRNEPERVIRDTTLESCYFLSAHAHFLRQMANVRTELPSESAILPVSQTSPNGASTEPVLPPSARSAAQATNSRKNSDGVEEDRSSSPKSEFGSIDCLDNLF
jgi:hypothetical protein